MDKSSLKLILDISRKWGIQTSSKIVIRLKKDRTDLFLLDENLKGYCKTTSIERQSNKSIISEIVVIDSNDIHDLAWTISHELFHVWQNERKPYTRQKWFIEGSAEYFAQLITYDLGFKILNKNYHPEYRSYFFRVKKVVDQIGWHKFVRDYF